MWNKFCNKDGSWNQQMEWKRPLHVFKMKWLKINTMWWISRSAVTYCVCVTASTQTAVSQNVDLTSQLLEERREMKVGRHYIRHHRKQIFFFCLPRRRHLIPLCSFKSVRWEVQDGKTKACTTCAFVRVRAAWKWEPFRWLLLFSEPFLCVRA